MWVTRSVHYNVPYLVLLSDQRLLVIGSFGDSEELWNTPIHWNHRICDPLPLFVVSKLSDPVGESLGWQEDVPLNGNITLCSILYPVKPIVRGDERRERRGKKRQEIETRTLKTWGLSVTFHSHTPPRLYLWCCQADVDWADQRVCDLVTVTQRDIRLLAQKSSDL